MKKRFFKVIVCLLALGAISLGNASAQSLSNLFNSSTVQDVVDQVTDNFTTLSKTDMAGEWKYNGFASSFESDNLLNQAGGAVVSSQIDAKMDAMGAKIGMNSSTLSFTFTSGDDFSATILSKSLSGTYTLDGSTKEVVLSIKASSINLTSLNAQVSKSGDTLYLYFQADKLLELLTKVAGSSSVSSLSTISTLMSSYDGLLLGFELVQ
ncbi:MAG: DUF4923 family protein [Rikenellaceae bacterium]